MKHACFRSAVLLALLHTIALTAANGQAKGPSHRPFVIDDLFAIDRPMSVALAPRGDRIAVVTERWSAKGYYARTSTLWLMTVDDRALHRLVPDTTETQQQRPAWSADGQMLAYVATRRDTVSLRVMRVPSGQPVSIPSPCGVGETALTFAWAPRETRLAVVCEAMPPRPTPDTGAVVVLGTGRSTPPHDMTPLGGTPRHTLLVLDVPSRRVDTLTTDCYIGGALRWDPSGTALWMLTATGSIYNLSYKPGDQRIVRVNTKTRTVTPLGLTLVGMQTPILSPTGTEVLVASRDLAFLQSDSAGWPNTWRYYPLVFHRRTTDDHIVSVDTLPNVFFGWQLSGLAWTPARAGAPLGMVYLTLSEHASQRIYGYDPATRRLTPVTPPNVNVASFSLSANGTTMAVVSGDANTPNDVSLIDLQHPTRTPRRLTTFGDQIRARHTVAHVDLLQWRSKDDRFLVHGFLVKPLASTPGTRCPLIVDVHGGPGVLYLNTFDEIHYKGGHEVPPELYAAAGYCVLMVNPRGDPSYTPQYFEALREGWVYPTRYDIFAGVDTLIQQGVVDSTRVGIAGASYGGWVTTFAITQTSRFRAASANDPVVDLGLGAALAYTGAQGSNYWMFTGFAGAQPGDTTFVPVDPRRVSTPILLRFGLTSGDPLRPSQFYVSGLPFYTYLHAHGVPVEMLLHPREGHGIFDWGTLRDYIARDLAWFNYWLKDEPYPDPAPQVIFDRWRARPTSGSISPHPD